jgi:hypothetical protein
VIEGENEAVIQLYENIKADPRHNNIILLSQDPHSGAAVCRLEHGLSQHRPDDAGKNWKVSLNFWKMTSAPVIFGNIPPRPTFCC